MWHHPDIAVVSTFPVNFAILVELDISVPCDLLGAKIATWMHGEL